MSDWNLIRMTQARQVAELMEFDPTDLPDEDAGVEPYYRALRQRSPADALDFIGHALPRLEAVAWAAHVLDQESRRRALSQRDRLALDSALRWTGDPDDANRRRARDAADGAGPRSPERLLGYAVFFSGGSLSEPDLPPVLPPASVCGRLAANAVKIAAYRSEVPEAVFARALDLAEQVAEKGVFALQSV